MIWSVYHLVDPRTEKVWYVGVSTKDPILRLVDHISEVGRPTPYSNFFRKKEWILDLLRLGLAPHCRTVAQFDLEVTARAFESSEILRLLDSGVDLLNGTGRPVPETVRRKRAESISKAKKGRTYEEVFGAEKAAQIRAAHSTRMKARHAQNRGQ